LGSRVERKVWRAGGAGTKGGGIVEGGVVVEVAEDLGVVLAGLLGLGILNRCSTNLMKRKSYYKGGQRTSLRSSTLIIYYRDESVGRAFGRASASCWQGYVTKSAIFASFLNIISFKL